jgi:CheY-like chemotaxis protein
VSTTVGKGSVFFAVLPRVAVPPAKPEIRTTADAVGKPTILIVEDDAHDREHLASALERAGYAVEAVATGAQAVERGQTRMYDAITLDLLLPDMTGLEVLQQLRATRNTNVPIVLITIVAEKGAVAGFAVHDILPKPLDEAALVASLARAGVTPGKDEILVIDDDSASLEMISTMLGQLGHPSHCEANPVVGLARAIATKPRAIILDLIMPGLSGFELLDQLRKDPVGRGIPVIVWTAKDLTADEHATLRRLASVVVPKSSDGTARMLAELTAILPARAA